MSEYSYGLRVPKERVAVLIGKSGEVKKEIEENTKTVMEIDSKEGDVTIRGDDAVSLYSAKEIITAIGRGFNPQLAMLLLKQDYVFEVIDITEFASNKSKLLRLKGRLIGAEGKCRRYIESLTDCNISVYGKTVSIIGMAEYASIARHAIVSLLNGSPHSKVYKWLEGKMKNIKCRMILS